MKKDIMHDSDNRTDIRINKFLSDAGICSRREADRLISGGHVLIDGVEALPGQRVAAGQQVSCNGRNVVRNDKMVLIAFNKPRGIVCTTERRRGTQNIVDYVDYPSRIYPIGRLDKDSEGLILMTNDGGLVNRIMKASMMHEKEYTVRVNKPLTDEFIRDMGSGVPILDTVTRPCSLKRLDEFTFSIILTQGLNRQIRRMCQHFDYKVVSLQRTRIMNIRLGHLKSGQWRNVTRAEIDGLRDCFELDDNEADRQEETDYEQ